jgi:hypothetical protein
MMARTHELKTWPEYFDAVFERKKTFEVRKNDRDFEVGDILILRRFDPSLGAFTGGLCGREVTYILQGGQFGIEPGHVVLGLR